jgi:hypothetical protein
MVAETTWGSENRRTEFEWTVTTYGIVLDHRNGAPPYIIPWDTFSRVLTQARSMASTNGNQVIAGVGQTNPTQGSVGEWVLGQTLPISDCVQNLLTPRHLSFIGPILGRMGLATNTLNGNAIIWHFTFP